MDYRIVKRWKGPWIHQKRVEAAAVAVALVAAFLVFTAIRPLRRSGQSHPSIDCHFPAIFNFGDSNSDTGSVSAAFGWLIPPYGQTFFGKPSGRYSDGRLMIDFIAEKLGLPYLNAYLDSIGTNFRHGANFAASGSTIQTNSSLLHLAIQISQFEQFQARAVDMYNQVSMWFRGVSAKRSRGKNSLPTPEDFSKSLYTMDVGQNDLYYGLRILKAEQPQESIPGIIDQFALAVERLYKQGARAFWIHNTGPIGCLPILVIASPPKPGDTDQEEGCHKSYNELAQEFNKQLKHRMSQLRTEFEDALLIYVDIYSAKYTLISEAKDHGFVDPLGYCCGHSGKYDLQCGERVTENETEYYGGPCSNPSQYISWDSTHFTESANHWVANRIMDGSLSDPNIPVTQLACHKL